MKSTTILQIIKQNKTILRYSLLLFDHKEVYINNAFPNTRQTTDATSSPVVHKDGVTVCVVWFRWQWSSWCHGPRFIKQLRQLFKNDLNKIVIINIYLVCMCVQHWIVLTIFIPHIWTQYVLVIVYLRKLLSKTCVQNDSEMRLKKKCNFLHVL